MTQPAPDHGSQTVDLREFFAVVRRRRLLVAAATIVTTLLAVGLIARRPPVYSATAEVEVRPLTAQTSQYGSFYDLQSSMDNEAARVLSEPIVQRATALGAPEDAHVNVSVPTNTTYIDITCTTPQPAEAAACAQAYVDAYAEDREAVAAQIYEDATKGFRDAITEADDAIAGFTEQLKVALPGERQQLLADIRDARRQRETAQLQLLNVPTASGAPAIRSYFASIPTEPSNKGYVAAAFLALVVGFVLGIGLALLRDRLDERIGGRTELERDLGVPVIALVPKVLARRRSTESLVSLAAPNGAASEAYRTARTTLLYLAKESGIRVVAVTGPGQGEGKTTTTSNLAVTLAQSGKRVIVISGDLRRPTLHRYFGVPMGDGLSDVLLGTVELRQVVQKTQVPGLLVMPSGHVPSNPAELLASPAMDQVIDELSRAADFVLIDTPPALIVSDVLGLAPKVDGLMIVVDASSTPRSALAHLRAQIDRVGGNLIGSILNNFDRNTSKYYDTYRGYSMDGERYRAPEPVVSLEDDHELVATNGHADAGERSNGNGNGGRRTGRRARKHATTGGGAPSHAS
jgi:tyrosine-protein kinase